MNNEITRKLNKISESESITFLLAVESGSRAWGFPSPDSDYDVRTIFIYPESRYLSVVEPKETFEYIENQWFDVGGWELRKALNLLAKSNPVLLEWFNSPISYYQSPQFVEKIQPLLTEHFQVSTAVHHYRGIAKGALSALNLDREIKLKKWLYVLRPLLAAKWTYEKQDIPPMEISKLYQDLPISLQNEINELIQLKSTKSEGYLHFLSSNLVKLTRDLIDEVNNIQISSEKKQLNFEPLNDFFRSTLKESNK